jgi:hypothetical protein
MLTKSKAAFQLSAETLFSMGRRVYMWTFTFPRVVDDEVAFACWNHLRTLLCREFKKGDLPGIRVVEVHPGGHGLHFHVLIAKRLPVQEVRRMAIRAGFGRIHVQKAKKSSWRYLAKYLGKQDDGLKKGCRRWGFFGSFKGTRVKDIVIESTLAENCRKVREVVGTWGRDLYLAVYKLTVKYGHCLEWPEFAALKPSEAWRFKTDNNETLPDGCDSEGRKVLWTYLNILQPDMGFYSKVYVVDRQRMNAMAAQPF